MRITDQIKLRRPVSGFQLYSADGDPLYDDFGNPIPPKKKHKKVHYKSFEDGTIYDPRDYVGYSRKEIADILGVEFDDHVENPKKRRHHPGFLTTLGLGLAAARIAGYLAGDEDMPKHYRKKAQLEAESDALELSRTTHKTSKKLMKSGSDYVNNPKRSERAAKYESAKQFYKGLADAYAGSGKLKSWVVNSGDPCQECEDADGEDPIDWDDTFEANDLAFPPGHLNCIAGDAIISASGVTATTKRRYKGEIFVFSIKGLNDLALTGNHPILTDRGWVLAKHVQTSDCVAKCVDNFSFINSLVNPNNNYIETSFEKISSSLAMSGGMSTSTMPTSPETFHGDGILDEKINVVWANSLLSNYRSLTYLNVLKNKLLSPRQLSRISFSGYSSGMEAFGSILRSSAGSLSFAGLPFSFFQGNASIHQGAGFRFLPKNNSFSFQDSANSTSTNTKESSNKRDRITDIESTDPFSLLRRKFNHLEYSAIAQIKTKQFDGFVHNLSTRDHFYIANDIIVHNCECSILLHHGE